MGDKFKFNLGDKVKCKVTGFEGIIIGRHEWLYGCTTYSVKPQKVDKDGKPQESASFDESGIELVADEVLVNPAPVTTGGPAPRVDPVIR